MKDYMLIKVIRHLEVLAVRNSDGNLSFGRYSNQDIYSRNERDEESDKLLSVVNDISVLDSTEKEFDTTRFHKTPRDDRKFKYNVGAINWLYGENGYKAIPQVLKKGNFKLINLMYTELHQSAFDITMYVSDADEKVQRYLTKLQSEIQFDNLVSQKLESACNNYFKSHSALVSGVCIGLLVAVGILVACIVIVSPPVAVSIIAAGAGFTGLVFGVGSYKLVDHLNTKGFEATVRSLLEEQLNNDVAKVQSDTKFKAVIDSQIAKITNYEQNCSNPLQCNVSS